VFSLLSKLLDLLICCSFTHVTNHAQECEELMAKGITGSGEGFDLPGKRLGGNSRQPPLSSLRKTALAAAEKRSQVGTLLPSGPNRIGGDSVIMKALSPVQAAAMAAERRLQDDLWCGSQSCDNSDHEDVNRESAENLVNKQIIVGTSRLTDNSTLPLDPTSRKRSRDKDSSLPVHSSSNPKFVDLTMDTPKKGCVNGHQIGSQQRSSGLESILHSQAGLTSKNLPSSPGSLSGDSRTLHSEETAMWQCLMCTLLNKVSIQLYHSHSSRLFCFYSCIVTKYIKLGFIILFLKYR